ncbi:MAG: glycosyltransferase family 4 protein [Patescibacteria group bacterium]|nr:glycosyltransferase family 4 protein [Patescibacteria group bacterium]
MSARILLLVRDRKSKAGSGRNAANMIKAITAAGFELDILDYDGRFISYVWRAIRAAQRADIVQAVDMNPLGFAGYIATRFARAKFVIVAQAGYALAPLDHRKTRLASRMAYRAADRIVAGSAFIAREIERRVPGVQVGVIDPGIDLNTFPGSSAEHIPDGAPLMIGVGAVKARKGYDVSMKAFAIAKRTIPALRYVIVGSQTDEPRFFASVQALAQELGVAKDVEFLSGISDKTLDDLYRRASLFILTSSNVGAHMEGFGMVFLEAAAYGLPSIGTTGNGIEGAVANGRTGMLVPQNDPDAAARAIVDILGEKDRAKKMGQEAKLFAKEHDIPHLIELYSALYRDMLGR